jgi:RNA polymerase sigma-70 factor (ECF subfamily)
MMTRTVAALSGAAAKDAEREPFAQVRLRAIVRANYAFLWRSLRRLGVAPSDLDDAAQRSLGVLARRLEDIAAGSERAFLFKTALRVASQMRRSQRRDRLAFEPERVDDAPDPQPLPDEAIARSEARALLDEVLDAMPLDVRAVFVLFELEQLTTSEIAALLEIPAGTVSSRLRRGREQFEAIARRMRARHAAGGRR